MKPFRRSKQTVRRPSKAVAVVARRCDGLGRPSYAAHSSREGKVLLFLAVSLPMLFGMLGLVVDGGLLMKEHRGLQTAADAAATTAARQISLGKSLSAATQAAVELVHEHNALPDATVTVNRPPSTGPFAGKPDYVEVIVSRAVESNFIQVVSGGTTKTVQARAVAGIENATSGGVLVVLDPDPSPVNVSGLPAGIPALGLPALHLGGLELLGLGQLRVQGAVFVNTEWGGQDENGDPAGEEPPLGGSRHAITCTPILPLTRLLAEDIRVTGGVDNPANYGNVQSGESSPLKANKPAVLDPLRNLPAPTVAADPFNVSATERGTVNIVSLPLLAPPVTLQPGVYESITIVTGTVIFQPGVYIIRNKNPLTGISLSIVAGRVTANGVMFYITDSAAYTPADGLPDANDGGTVPAAPGVPSLAPSVVINAGLLGSTYSGLSSASSPFDGMLVYQRRTDRRPIAIVAEQLLGGTAMSGTVYAKWGQLLFVGHGTYDMKFAVGTARIVNALSCTFAPTTLFPPVREVFLVE